MSMEYGKRNGVEKYFIRSFTHFLKIKNKYIYIHILTTDKAIVKQNR